MSEVVHKRMRTVKLLEILQQESDLDNPITTNELCRKLSEKGIATDRRTIPKDIEALNLQGYEIMSCKIGRQNAYYIDDRSFSLPELKILIDAVQAANFITEKKTSELIRKIAALGGNHQAEILTENIVHFNNHKHTNEQIYYTVSVLEKAIRAEQKVTFKYFDLNEKHEKIYRHNEKLYTAEPVALIFNNDNYYLMTFDANAENGIRNYRVDRMDHVMIDSEKIRGDAKAKMSTVSEYTSQMFEMYDGRIEKITLSFDKKNDRYSV